MNMEDKYAEIVAKHGPLFKNLIYLERLNLNETSLRIKWTTELFEEDVEVMPIIFEDDEFLQQDYYEEKTNEVEQTSSSLRSEIHIESISSGQVHEIEQLNLNKNNDSQKFPCGESWWIALNDDTAAVSNQVQNIQSPTQSMADLMAFSKASVPTSVIFETTASEVKDSMKLVAEQPSDDESDEICMLELVHSAEKRTQISASELQKNEDLSDLLDPSVASVEYSLEENNTPDTIELKLPCPVSSQKCLHELKFGRISRPLSGKYTLEEEGEKSLKHVKRTESIMDLTSHGDMENLSLSSMYDDLCAGNSQKKLNLKTERPAISFREWSRNPYLDKIAEISKKTPLLGSKSSLIAHTSGKNKNIEENHESILEPGVKSKVMSAFGQKQKPTFAPNIPPNEFRPILEKKMEKLSKKRPYPDSCSRKDANN